MTLRCFLFGHEWVPVRFDDTGIFPEARDAVCVRCEAWVAFVDDEDDDRLDDFESGCGCE